MKIYKISISHLFITLVLMIVIVGCSSKDEPVGFSDVGNNRSTEMADNIGQPELQDWILNLGNGMQLEIYSFSMQFDTLILNVGYLSDDNNIIERKIKIVSLTGVTICTISDEFIYSYEYFLIDSNNAEFITSTNTDFLTVDYSIYDDTVSILFNYNGDMFNLAFSSQREFSRAKYICWEVFEKGVDVSLDKESQELLQRFLDLESYLTRPNSFENNRDVEVAMYLMNCPEFLDWFSRNYAQSGKECDVSCMCHIAGLVSLSCFFPPAVVICVPAAGLSAACAIAGLISLIFGV